MTRPWWNQWLRFRRALLPGHTGGPAAGGRDFLTLHVLLDGDVTRAPTWQEDVMRLGIPSIFD